MDSDRDISVVTQIQMIHLCSYFSFLARALISVARLGDKLPIEPNEISIETKNALTVELTMRRSQKAMNLIT